MKTPLFTLGTALAFALGVQAQNPSIVIPPGKLAVFKAGLPNTNYNISISRVQPCFVQVFDPVTINQAAPIYSQPLPTNQPNGIWINDHAGSEGGGISRSADRHILALEGYTGNILSPTNAKPSSDPTVYRGLGTLDAFGNEQVLYQDLANWFGMPPGVTQNNPTGIATADGTSFWGTGNVTGGSAEAAGTLFYNGSESSTPIELQNYIQAAAEARILNGTLYIVVPGGGVYNFLDPQNNDAVVPLPYDPNVPNPVEHIVLTNLFLNWGSTFTKIANFDMNPAGTIAYGADQTYGIVKFVNTSGTWQQASYYFNSNNIGTTLQPKAQQGCFGICVDFSGPNPIIYATTMEFGAGTPGGNNQGNPNNNRLIRIVDSGNPGTALVAQTLATATTTNESFRGIDFSPDLTPLITSQPVNYATVSGGSAAFSVTASSVYALSFQWLQNGTNLLNQTNATLSLSALDTTFNLFQYECVVTNLYGVVTSTPGVLTVTLTAVAPVITNTPVSVTGFINGQVTFAPISPTGTEPLSFYWYFGGSQLTDGYKYTNSATASLTISNLAASDGGSYYLVASNSAGFASNLVDVLTVHYHLPTITAGEPQSVTTFVGLTTSLTATQGGGTAPVTNQWYKGSTLLTDVNEYSGTATSTLTIGPVSSADQGSYKIVVSNGGGSATSQVATVTVLTPLAHSYVAYSNQFYFQNFDALPDPGSNSVNSINNPLDVGSINGISYSLANPFDFTYPVITSSYVGGLGLASMPGWYGATDTLYAGVDGITRFGAQDGDQTTGGVIDFGPNDNGSFHGANRALGLLSTSTTGSTTFALKLVNTSAAAVNSISLGFIGELWHNGTGSRVMSFGYTLDPSASSFLLTSESITNVSTVVVTNLCFSFPTAPVVTTVDGTQSANQVVLGTNNMALASSWTPNGALWLIWSINFYGSGSGNGYAIDNLNFYAAPATNTLTAPTLTGVAYHSTGVNAGLEFNFVSSPGVSTNFSVLSTTNIALPLIQWQNLGNPTEVSFGHYSFLDAQATAEPERFYQIVGTVTQ